MKVLPLFPLETVVFPGMTLPLRVFEARYKRLVKAAMDMEKPAFVVGTLPDTGEAEPAEAGTRMEIVETQDQPDGTIHLLAHGIERVRVTLDTVELVAEPTGGERPLHWVNAEPWPVERVDPNAERLAAWDAVTAFEAYSERFFAESVRKQARAAMPDEPLYQASFVCANLHLPYTEARRLLAAPSLVQRLSDATDMMYERLTEDIEDVLGDTGQA